MNFKFCYFIVLFLIFTQNTTVQNTADMEVTYQMKFISDTTKMQNQFRVDNLILLFNKNSSIYYSQEAKDYYEFINQAATRIQNDKTSLGRLPSQPKIKGSIYKIDDIITATLPVGKYLYSFEEPSINWQILNETKEINGLECRLAKTTVDTGDTFFAWFTIKEYPFSEGPFRFKGLPGLILSVFNKNRTIEIDAIEIRKSQAIIEPYFNDKAIKLKNKGMFIKARQEYYENPNIQNNNNIIVIKNGELINNEVKKRITNNVFLD